MLFNFALFSSLLLVPAVLAVPSVLGASVTRRSERRLSQPRMVDAVSDPTCDSVLAGASLSEDNGTLSWVTGTFTVPTISGSPGASLSTWVGLDGIGCETGSTLSAGVIFTIDPSGQPEYNALFRWSSQDSQSPSDVTISAGDVVRLSIFTHNATSAETKIENLTGRQKASQLLTFSIPLCLQSAQWIGQNLTADLPLADSPMIAFIDALAGGEAATYTPSGSNVTLYDWSQGNQTVTSTSAYGPTLVIKNLLSGAF